MSTTEVTTIPKVIRNTKNTDYNIYRRTYQTEDVLIPTLADTSSKDLFLTIFTDNTNIDLLARTIAQELDIHDNKLIPILRLDVITFIQRWINLGKFEEKQIIRTSSVSNQVALYNKMFIDVFKYNFQKKYDYTYDSNPFFEVINGKKRKDFRPEDYASLNVQQQRIGHQRSSLNVGRQTIPFHEKVIYKRHHTNQADTHTTHGNDRNALIYTDTPKFNTQIKPLDDRSSNSEDTYEKAAFNYKRYPSKDIKILRK